MSQWQLKTPAEIEVQRAAGKIVFGALEELERAAAPGVATAELNRIAEAYIRDCGAEPAFLGYQGYPAAVCVSIDDQVVHGIPGPRQLENGMVVAFDVGAKLDGFFSDAARTVGVGEISAEDRRLIEVTQRALAQGIEQARLGRRLFDISAAIQQFVEQAGYSVVRDLVGHGIGRKMHEEPQVPNYGTPGGGPELEEGLVIAIEPMVNAGRSAVRLGADRWTIRTKDGSKSAHFEHTVAITRNGPDILTAKG